ncbi:helicase-related protein [Sphingomonas sp. S1-29]|uniref:helicase-related protein n=1 Tax=Sphingomonas sp. S1-29 TaxID=2991074 RepID=UPI00223F8965|nr:helicase-related protein [Sphingomonas sp. S1-29]UZK70482.1 helicase-related protein [Sphingomonas sp. S1-29]
MNGTHRTIVVTRDEHRAQAIARLAAAFSPEAVVIHVPASDALPGDAAPPSAANVGLRVAALRRLRQATTAKDKAPILLVVSAEASAVRYAEPAAFNAAPPVLSVGDPIEIDSFSALAETMGYFLDDRVDEPGEIAVRGSVIDLYPADRETPVRIGFNDGVIDAIRAYDPISQLAVEELSTVTIGQASEPAPENGVPITDHLSGAAVHVEPGAAARRDRFLGIALDGGTRRRGASAVVTAEDWAAAIGDRIASFDITPLAPPPRFAERADPVRAFRRFAKSATAEGRLLIAGSLRDLRFIAARMTPPPLAVESLAQAAAASAGAICTLAAPLDRGFVQGDHIIVAAADLLGSRAQADTDHAAHAAFSLAGNGELHVGDVVVHEDHGIGVVAGLEMLPQGGDAIVLEYAKGARRLAPAYDAGRVWRYGADRDAVTLDTLDGASWIKRRASIDTAIAESARALTALAAERDARTADPIEPDRAAYERFAATFPFSETIDQARAIAAVRADLASGRPMDRLVVGDVGYGKTEVALRAAALVALGGRQVAIVAPTTVLVRQHLDTFTKRFAGTGREVAGLSRLSSAAERKRVKAGLADGSISIVVGTAAVAGRGVDYADLALVVIDEEQRFGAAAKASLRAMGAGHSLTLSATPIPRTLQSALVGLQAISIIATPPARRQPIRTVVETFDSDMVAKALRRERARGGQSFVVVPRIEDIAPLEAKLAKLVPELGVVVAHGRMDANMLDEAMADFAAGDGDVLLATNIIEAGLDVPRANTMIVHHADRFGLSQLHQLRGRVGRGGRRGHILLLTADGAKIADTTIKRLRTLQALDQLGAGFAIGARDLDMRGAGDLVGEEQAGHMKLIGTDLYQHLLGRALRVARGDDGDRWQPELKLGIAGWLPDDWIPETDIRLTLYGRLARITDAAALDAFEAELEDRFGALPEPAALLVATMRIGILADAAGIRQVDVGPGAIALTPVDLKAALPEGFEQAKSRWLVRERIDDPQARLARVGQLLDNLAECYGG